MDGDNSVGHCDRALHFFATRCQFYEVVDIYPSCAFEHVWFSI